jgi:SAM-dependent methyltransferase
MRALLPHRLGIGRHDRVLEIGSGGRPHSRSNVLLDRFVDDGHREGRVLVRDQRPLLIADGEALPFRDQSFDYCICMHVLEHVEHPERLLAEMQRVARAGYIETPTELFDWMFSVPPYTEIHRWFVNAAGGELVLTRKTPDNSRHRFAHLFDVLRAEDPHFERWLEKRPHLFTVQHEWRGMIRYRFSDDPPGALLDNADRVREFLCAQAPASRFFWGSGGWGFKRWVYSWLVHPVWRKRARCVVRMVASRRGSNSRVSP